MNLNTALGLRSKIALPFAITALAIVLTGALGYNTTRTLISSAEQSLKTLLPAISESLNGDRDLYQALVAQMSYIEAVSNNEDGSGYRQDFEENAQQALDRLNQAQERLNTPQVDDLMTGFQQAYDRWKQQASRSMTLAANGNPDAAKTLLAGDASDSFDVLRDYFDNIGVAADELAHQSTLAAVEHGNSNTALTVTVTVVSLLIGGLLFLLFMKMIVASISVLRNQLDDIAQGEGDLTKRIPVETNDDLGQLANSFNKVLENLQSMIRSIQQLANQLAEGARDLELSAQENNTSVTRQTDAIAMVATAINEMQSAIEEVAGNASRASEVTRDAQANGNRSAETVRASSGQVQRLASQISKAVEVIRKLSEDSDNITSVLDVIRGIAEQTNLLALNAAIEAARAGDQGRGFAVVADEVRTLAQRTQESTEDIQSMITALQTGVAEIVSVMEAGSEQASETERLAEETVSELASIISAMDDINDVSTSVASATEEQTQVVDEINQNIVQINDLASDGTNRSEQFNGISQSLAGYARELNEQTGRFRV